MATLKKKSKSTTPSSPTTPSSSQGNPTLLIGIILAVGVGLLLFLFTTNMQKKTSIVIAKSDIPAFSTIQSGQVEFRSVPSDSVGNELTEASYNEYVKKGQPIINRVEILPGQKVDSKVLVSSPQGSLAVVKSDEQVVAVSTSITGAAGMLIAPGSVVDVYSSSGDSSQPLVTQAKVLAVGMGTQAASDVRPNNKVKGGGSSTELIVILAVKSSDAGKLLNQSQVSLSYNPHKTFDAKGNIVAVTSAAPAENTSAQSSSGLTGATDSGQTQTTTTPQGG